VTFACILLIPVKKIDPNNGVVYYWPEPEEAILVLR
jgi:hypothetical protein